MGCCGNQAIRRSPTPGNERAPVTIEYSGHGSVTLFGRMTGGRYHFPAPGARVVVDARDAPSIEIVRGFTVVQRA